MCPPVSVRHGKEGMSCLYASWRYQLQYGGQLRICFTCFKVTFLGLRALLQSANWEDWDEDDWDSELMDHVEEEEEEAAAATAPAEAGSEQGASQGLEPNWGQGLGQPALWGPAGWGWGTLASPPGESEETGLEHDFVPTELNPQDAAPLGLGPEDADWTQGLPWRFGGFPACLHWPHTSSPWQGLLKVDRSPGEPMLLELGTTQAGEPAEAEACLLDLQFLSMVDHADAFYLQKMTPRWARRTADQGWTVLLEPEEVWAMALPNAAQGQDPQRWKLSVLEPSPTGHTVELTPADVALLKRGFTILSYSSWDKSDAADGDPASRPQSSTQGEGPSTPETWSSGPREPWESLGPGAAALSAVPLPRAPEMRD